jgi:hypothetical protein
MKVCDMMFDFVVGKDSGRPERNETRRDKRKRVLTGEIAEVLRVVGTIAYHLEPPP